MKLMLGRLTIDDAALVITLDGRPLPAPPKVVELIAVLGARRGEVLSKEILLERLWPQGYADDATVWQTIYLARKLLAKTGQATIETHPRRGYQLRCETAEPAPVAPPVRTRRVRPAATIAAAAMLLVALIALPVVLHRNTPSPLPPAALRAYNLGRYYLHQGTAVSLRHAIVEFQAVVDDAPSSALGRADLSEAEALYAENVMRGRRELLARASSDANAALRVDPRSVTAQTALAAAAFFAYEPPGKIDAAFKRAIALDDSYAITHMYYGEFLLMRNDLKGAYTQFHRATDLDPSLGDANVYLGLVAYKLGDPHTAIHYAREGLGFGAPDKVDAFRTLGNAYVAVGQPQSAQLAFRQLRRYTSPGGF
jgi:DNA-binding winged helix-turn-helix (wHTH) protein/Tfp pilus assembly protein PilF